MKKNNMLIVFLISISIQAFSKDEKCPYSKNSVDADVKVTVTKEGDLYKYSYLLSNFSSSQFPIKLFLVQTYAFHQSIVSPSDWEIKKWGEAKKDYVIWAQSRFEKGFIGISKSLGGFSFLSKNPPGPVKFLVQGGGDRSRPVQSVSHIEMKGMCPGFYQPGSSATGESNVTGITLGPVPSSIVAPEITIIIKDKKIKTGKVTDPENSLVSFAPDKTGSILIELAESEDLKIENIDMSSLTFGRGKAKVIKTQIVKDSNANNSRIVMEFDLQQTNVLCNLDRALFLEGSLKDGKKLMSGVRINSVKCDGKNWQKEMAKMIKNGQLDDSIYRK